MMLKAKIVAKTMGEHNSRPAPITMQEHTQTNTTYMTVCAQKQIVPTTADTNIQHSTTKSIALPRMSTGITQTKAFLTVVRIKMLAVVK